MKQLETMFNKHGDAVVAEKALPNSLQEFVEVLESSLVAWKARGC